MSSVYQFVNLKKSVLESWKKEAKDAIYSAQKSGVNMDGEACKWCGALTSVPEGITYNELSELLKHI